MMTTLDFPADATQSWGGDQGLVNSAKDPRLPPRWQLRRAIDRGVQGKVWLAHDVEADQPVAIKVFGHELSPAAREPLRRGLGPLPRRWTTGCARQRDLHAQQAQSR